MDVEAWLKGLGFQEYIEAFAENGVDAELLVELTNEDLKDLGVERLADRKRRTYIIAGGIFVWSLMTAACGLARNFWQLLLARVGVGVGEAALSPPAYSLIADYFPPNKLGRPLGLYSAGVFVGTALAFILGGALIQYFMNSPPVALPLVGELKPWQM